MTGLLINAAVRETIRQHKERASRSVVVLTPDLAERLKNQDSAEYKVHMELMAELTVRLTEDYTVTYSQETHAQTNGRAAIPTRHISVSSVNKQALPGMHVVQAIAEMYEFVFDSENPRPCYIYQEETADGTPAINIIQPLIKENNNGTNQAS